MREGKSDQALNPKPYTCQWSDKGAEGVDEGGIVCITAARRSNTIYGSEVLRS